LTGAAAALVATMMFTTSPQAASVGHSLGAPRTAGNSLSAIETVAYRRCWRRDDGTRFCRPRGYQIRSYNPFVQAYRVSRPPLMLGTGF
jgi:hypothetical protein